MHSSYTHAHQQPKGIPHSHLQSITVWLMEWKKDCHDFVKQSTTLKQRKTHSRTIMSVKSQAAQRFTKHELFTLFSNKCKAPKQSIRKQYQEH